MLRGCLSFPVRSRKTSSAMNLLDRPLPVRMNPMKRLVCRWSVGLALVAAAGAAIAVPGTHRAALAAGEQQTASATNSQALQPGASAVNQQVATVDQLKAQAFTALK